MKSKEPVCGHEREADREHSKRIAPEYAGCNAVHARLHLACRNSSKGGLAKGGKVNSWHEDDSGMAPMGLD